MWRMLIVLVLVSLCANTASALDGSGTQQDPWRIQSLADFDEFAADPNYWSGFTRLETDVNLAGRTYSTAVIAPDESNSYYFQGTPFTGVFDGNDHKIMTLTIDDGGAGNDYLGLFGCIGEDGEVWNLGLENGSVSGDSLVGGLVGGNGDWEYPGGTISNCYSTGDVNGIEDVGGLVGGNLYGTVANCYSTSDVNGVWDIGGLVGINGQVSGDVPIYPFPGYIIDSYSNGHVNGLGCVGCLVGWNSIGTISNSHSTGSVTGDGFVGGLVGGNDDSISNCYSTGDVNGVSIVGGLVGENDGHISNCYSTGDVNGYGNVGGLVGINSLWGFWRPSPAYIFDSYFTGSIQGTSSVGGLVGYNEAGKIKWSFWDVQTSGEPNMCGYQEYGTGCDPNCGKTTAEMKTISTFTDASWDFIEIWGIGEHQTYPYLRTEPSGDSNHDGKVDLVDFAILAEHWLEEK